MKGLLVDDDSSWATTFKDALLAAGICCDVARTRDDALAFLKTYAYQFAVIDFELPDGDGSSVLSELRSQKSSIAVMVLTSRSDSARIISALDAGADDFVTKPCDTGELLARIRALLRRPQILIEATTTLENLNFSTNTRIASVDDYPLKLSPKETSLLALLMRRTGQIVTRSALEESLYDCEAEFSGNSIEACVSRLRKSLANAKALVKIQTIRGIGYRLEAAGSDKSTAKHIDDAPTFAVELELSSILDDFAQAS